MTMREFLVLFSLVKLIQVRSTTSSAYIMKLLWSLPQQSYFLYLLQHQLHDNVISGVGLLAVLLGLIAVYIIKRGPLKRG